MVAIDSSKGSKSDGAVEVNESSGTVEVDELGIGGLCMLGIGGL